jgi:hypothetical protein
MLLEIDRVQLAVPEMSSVAGRWQALLNAEIDTVDKVTCLGASRTRLRLGTGFIEVLEPDGAGILSDAVANRGSHLFAAGASCLDVSGLEQQLAMHTKNLTIEDGQLFINGDDIGINGLRVVVSPHEERSAIGDIDFLYEATLLAGDSAKETAKFADIFQLDSQEFVVIESDKFGYDGTLTLFRKDLLHRFEVITPLDPANTIGRFFNKVGPCLYMAFAESSDMLAIEQRALDRGDGLTVDRPGNRGSDKTADQLWLHPAALGGMMLGLSRPTTAWQWSGHPERVEKI